MTSTRARRLTLTLLCVFAATAVPYAQHAVQPSASEPPSSTVPRSVPFNGQVLTPTGDVRTGTVRLTFGLYTDQQGGTPLWTEQQLVTLDRDGRYSVILGSTSAEALPAEAFAAGTPRWLGVQIEGEAEQPRFMLLSVPYALKAGDADTVGGKPVSAFVLSTNLFDAVKSTLHQHGLPVSVSTPAFTVGRLAKFVNNAGGVDDSIVTENTGKIGINQDNPEAELHVANVTSPQIRLERTGTSNYKWAIGMDSNTYPNLFIQEVFAGRTPFRILANASLDNGVVIGNLGVGIGNPAPSYRLHVLGYQSYQTARLDNSNNVGSALTLGWTQPGAHVYSIISTGVGANSGPGFLAVYDEGFGQYRLVITPNGDIGAGIDGLQNLGTNTRRWAAVYALNGTIQTSDARLKKDVTGLGYGLREVMQLRPVRYQWNDRNDGRSHLGLIAQEVEPLVPEAVEHGADAEAPLGLNYTSLVPVLIKAIQEQQAASTSELAAIRSEIATLKAQNATLEEHVVGLEQVLRRSTGQGVEQGARKQP